MDDLLEIYENIRIDPNAIVDEKDSEAMQDFNTVMNTIFDFRHMGIDVDTFIPVVITGLFHIIAVRIGSDLQFDPIFFDNALHLYQIDKKSNAAILGVYLYKHNQINPHTINLILNSGVPFYWSGFRADTLRPFLENGLNPIYIALSLGYDAYRFADKGNFVDRLDPIISLLDEYGVDWFIPVSINKADDISLIDYIIDQMYFAGVNEDVIEYLQDRIYQSKFGALDTIPDVENIIKLYRFGRPYEDEKEDNN